MSEHTEAPTAQLRALRRRLRRDKLALERLNPLEQPDAYRASLAHVADLEARRRDLEGELTAGTVPIPDDGSGDAWWDTDGA